MLGATLIPPIIESLSTGPRYASEVASTTGKTNRQQKEKLSVDGYEQRRCGRTIGGRWSTTLFIPVTDSLLRLPALRSPTAVPSRALSISLPNPIGHHVSCLYSPGELRDRWRSNRNGKQPERIDGACNHTIVPGRPFGALTAPFRAPDLCPRSSGGGNPTGKTGK
jgi:hypothetical protein